MKRSFWSGSSNRSSFFWVRRQWVSEKFFLNNEMPEKTRKNFMETAFSAQMRRDCHEIFSCPLVSLVVKTVT